MKLKTFIFCLFFVQCTFAGTQTGTVTQYSVRASDGLIHFWLEGGNPASKPACATYDYWMVKDENTDTGKRQFSIILAAYASGSEITVTGTGNCTRWVDGEDVNDITIGNHSR